MHANTDHLFSEEYEVRALQYESTLHIGSRYSHTMSAVVDTDLPCPSIHPPTHPPTLMHTHTYTHSRFSPSSPPVCPTSNAPCHTMYPRTDTPTSTAVSQYSTKVTTTALTGYVHTVDDTRVKLEPIPTLDGSDYINANYIDVRPSLVQHANLFTYCVVKSAHADKYRYLLLCDLLVYSCTVAY